MCWLGENTPEPPPCSNKNPFLLAPNYTSSYAALNVNLFLCLCIQHCCHVSHCYTLLRNVQTVKPAHQRYSRIHINAGCVKAQCCWTFEDILTKWMNNIRHHNISETRKIKFYHYCTTHEGCTNF